MDDVEGQRFQDLHGALGMEQEPKVIREMGKKRGNRRGNIPQEG